MYRQRLNWMQLERLDMQSMLYLEYRLRVHLHVLAHEVYRSEAEPQIAPDTFVYLASRLSSFDSKRQLEASALACEWLLENSARAQGARDALLLFPHPVVHEALSSAYHQNDGLRALLIYILAQHEVHLTRDLIDQAQLQGQDPQLQAQILYYAATQGVYGVEHFRAYYRPLLKHADNLPAHAVVVAALWGGLIRGDEVAAIALRCAIEREPDDMQRLDLLRLAALTGESAYLPIFVSLLQQAPQLAYHFLALNGKQYAVELILQGLGHPRTAKHAEHAWWWVSGQTLQKIPRLSVVGEDNLAEELEDNVGFVPDVQSAHQWWSKQKKDPGMRYLQGQQLSRQRILNTLLQSAGMISHDLIDLLAMHSKEPLIIGIHTWHDSRMRKIQSLSEAMANEIAVQHAVVQHA
jgi:hypothetical protein